MVLNDQTPNSTKQSNIFTPPPPNTKKKRMTPDIQNATHDSPNPDKLVPAFSNKENTANLGTPTKQKFKDDTPTQALALSPGRGSKRFTVVDSPPRNIGRNNLGLSQNTNKILDQEYDLRVLNSPPPLDTTNDRKRKKQQCRDAIQSKYAANMERIMQLRNGGAASITSSNGKIVYSLLDKTGKAKSYKYKKSFEKALLKQDGGIGIFQDLQNQFNSALGLTPQPKTKQPIRPVAPTQSAAPTRRAPNSKNDSRKCPPTHPYIAPNGINCTNIPPSTLPTQQPTLPKTPSKQYKQINGHPELVYEYYIPSTRKKRFLQLKNNHPDKVYDQILEKHVPRLVNNLIGFPRKTLDRATGRFIN